MRRDGPAAAVIEQYYGEMKSSKVLGKWKTTTMNLMFALEPEILDNGVYTVNRFGMPFFCTNFRCYPKFQASKNSEKFSFFDIHCLKSFASL